MLPRKLRPKVKRSSEEGSSEEGRVLPRRRSMAKKAGDATPAARAVDERDMDVTSQGGQLSATEKEVTATSGKSDEDLVMYWSLKVDKSVLTEKVKAALTRMGFGVLVSKGWNVKVPGILEEYADFRKGKGTAGRMRLVKISPEVMQKLYDLPEGDVDLNQHKGYEYDWYFAPRARKKNGQMEECFRLESIRDPVLKAIVQLTNPIFYPGKGNQIRPTFASCISVLYRGSMDKEMKSRTDWSRHLSSKVKMAADKTTRGKGSFYGPFLVHSVEDLHKLHPHEAKILNTSLMEGAVQEKTIVMPVESAAEDEQRTEDDPAEEGVPALPIPSGNKRWREETESDEDSREETESDGRRSAEVAEDDPAEEGVPAFPVPSGNKRWREETESDEDSREETASDGRRSAEVAASKDVTFPLSLLWPFAPDGPTQQQTAPPSQWIRGPPGTTPTPARIVHQQKAPPSQWMRGLPGTKPTPALIVHRADQMNSKPGQSEGPASTFKVLEDSDLTEELQMKLGQAEDREKAALQRVKELEDELQVFRGKEKLRQAEDREKAALQRVKELEDKLQVCRGKEKLRQAEDREKDALERVKELEDELQVFHGEEKKGDEGLIRYEQLKKRYERYFVSYI